MCRPLQLHLRLLLKSIVLLYLASATAAQSVSDYQVKAAYIYNFAKFIEWPAQEFSTPAAPMRFCVLNDQLFEVELNRVVKGRSIAGHPVEVVQVQATEQARSCHILFINSVEDRQTERVLETLRTNSVLTVGEAENFIPEGGIINFILKDNRVQFQINHKAATAAGLYISSRLLAVAQRVLE